ncbi:conserved hypothetical protein [Planktothrix serta PCC 8927]|uniref:Uncharacterized protein n=1 Tax=Planktothrix serta PCC 8927 TaxID=671068 RepID=A0A7Z9BLR4_9CYAN|nr:hypothetical protein [Planktothrix serta]VXD11155.1 conserved hypothetical protein [Planktothrix serta PCC 8927]
MTIICTLPPTQRANKSPEVLIRETVFSSAFHSLEHRKIAKFTDEIWRALTPSERQLTTPENIQEIDYKPVPPKRTFTVRVRYQFKGRIEPLPYQLDDE